MEASDRIEGTSSFVMIVAIRAVGRWSRPGNPGFGSRGGAEVLAISSFFLSLFLLFQVIASLYGNWRPEEDDGCNLLRHEKQGGVSRFVQFYALEIF